MARCKEQEMEVTQLVEGKAQEAVEFLSNKSFKEAQKLAEALNKSHFFNNPVIKVSQSQSSREDGITEVNISKDALSKTIDDKIEDDNKLEMEQRIQELREGNNLDVEMPAGKTVTQPYNEFSWENVFANKLKLKNTLEKQRDLIKNKKRSKEQLQQVEYLNETIRRLHIDLINLDKTEKELDAYVENLNNDMHSIELLLKDPTLDNIEAINNYIEIMNRILKEGNEGFLNLPLKDIKDKDVEVHGKIRGLRDKLNALRDDAETETRRMIMSLIRTHLKQKEEYKNADDFIIDEEVSRLYNNQIQSAAANVPVTSRVSGMVGDLKGQVTMLDDTEQEIKNVLLPVLYKVYTDAIAMNNNKEKRKLLSDMQDKVKSRLIELGHIKGKGTFFKRADQSVFTRKSGTTHQLIGKFSTAWVNFQKKMKSDQNLVSKILYRPEKTKAQNELIQKQFNTLNENADFLDVTRVPEIMEEFESMYGETFMSQQEAEQYRQDLIDKIGQREYDKLVEEQKQNIHAYNIFKEVREARLMDKYDIEAGAELDFNTVDSEAWVKDWNTHLHMVYSKSPFVFAQNYRDTGTNQITRPFKIGNKIAYSSTPVDLEYVSYSPKKEKHFDQDFKAIEQDKVLNDAWSVMADLVEYNNNNGFNNKPNDLNEYSLASQEKRARNIGMRIIGLFSPETLRNIHKGIATSKYKDPHRTNQVAGSRITVDQEINDIYRRKVAGLNGPTKAQKDTALREAKEIVMKRQDEDIMTNILASTEMTEMFKAKREIESKVLFLKNALLKETDRAKIKEIAEFFTNKELYQINNRANWNVLGKSFHMGNWSKYYTAKEKDIRKITKESKKRIQERIKSGELSEEMEKSARKEIESIDKFLDSQGMVVTPGSIIEGLVIKLMRVAAFSINVSAQITNQLIANVNAWEVDGRQGFWDAGVYHDAKSFSRKWKNTFLNGSENNKVRKEIKVGELLLQRLQIFQNSSNEIFKLEKSRAATSLQAVLENPMNFVSEVEKTIQRPQIFALLSQVKIQGKDINGADNIVPMWDPKTRTFPAFTEVNGELVLKPAFDTSKNRETFLTNESQEYANLFGDAGKIPKAIAYINGDYRETSAYLFEKNTLTAMMMLFKRWSVATLSKKFGVIKRLGKNEAGDLANVALAWKGGAYALAAGSLIGPVGMTAVMGAYALYHGPKIFKRQNDTDARNIINARTILQSLKAIPSTMTFHSTWRIGLAAAAQSLSMIIDPFTKKQYINSDHIKRIMNVKSTDRRPLSEKQIREIQDDLYFITTSVAATMRFVAMKYLVAMALFPDEEEEEAHKERIKNKDKFWRRMYEDPDTAMYYTLENMLSGFIDDSNMTENLLTGGLVREGDMFGLKKFSILKDDMEKTLKGEGELKGGVDKGSNRFWVHLLKYYTPAAIKDGGSLGFGSKSKRDYDETDPISQSFKPEKERINSIRLEERNKEKKKLEKLYEAYPEKRRKSRVDKKLREMFPTLKDKHFDKDGKLKSVYKHKYPYWED